jgi:ABC-2 type transport system permease protein
MSRYKPRGVITKTLYDRRWFLLGWFLGFAFLAWFVGVFYSTFGSSDVINQQFQNLPPALKSIAGLSGDFNTVPGYYGSQIFGKTMPMVAAVLGIMLGISLATEEEDGTLQTLLAAPVSRTRVYLSKWFAPVLIFASLMVGLAMGLGISLWQQSLSLDVVKVIEATANVWVFLVFFLSLTYAVAAIFGKRSIAIAVSSILAVSGYFLNAMAAGVEALKPYDKLSVYYYYGSENVLVKGLNFTHVGIMAGVSIVLLIIGGLIFARRNIATA